MVVAGVFSVVAVVFATAGRYSQTFLMSHRASFIHVSSRSPPKTTIAPLLSQSLKTSAPVKPLDSLGAMVDNGTSSSSSEENDNDEDAPTLNSTSILLRDNFGYNNNEKVHYHHHDDGWVW